MVPSENETWLIEVGDEIIVKKSEHGRDALTACERLLYCLWVADYSMRNAGDLRTAADLYSPFHEEGLQLAEQLQLPETKAASVSQWTGWKKPISQRSMLCVGRCEPVCDANVRFPPIADIASLANLLGMERAYLLQHERPDTQDVKVIGLYSTLAAARAAVERLQPQPGFRDYPDHFIIDAYELDEDHWAEGFADS